MDNTVGSDANDFCKLYKHIIQKKEKNLLELPLHARHQHDAGDTHSQKQEEGVDEPRDRGVVSTGATSAQKARSTATKAGDLKRKRLYVRV